MKYYLIAGEASGDMYGARLMQALKAQDPNAEFRFWGGKEMLKEDPNIVMDYSNTSFMGFVEVLKNIGKVLRFIKICKADILKSEADILILIDYPGFNLRIAKWAKQKGLHVVYYVSPQIWAWKANRIHQMKRDIDQVYVILPFEKSYFESKAMHVDYFGHPLIEIIKEYTAEQSDSPSIQQNVIACLPGSRAQEIKAHLRYIIQLANLNPNENFVIAGHNSIAPEAYGNPSIYPENLKLVIDKTYEIFSAAKAGIISSGTATLEACLFEIPQLVIYKGNYLSYQIAKRIVKVNYISLVNLIADKRIVNELIQSELNIEQLNNNFQKLLDADFRETQIKAYRQIKALLGEGNTSDQIARSIIQKFNSSSS